MQDAAEGPGPHLDEEPQEARGPMGSRDTGTDEPAGGPADRPVETAKPEDTSKVARPKPIDEDMPPLIPGDQGG